MAKATTGEDLKGAFEKQLAEPLLIVTTAKDATKPVLYVVFLKWKVGTSKSVVDKWEKSVRDFQYKISGEFCYFLMFSFVFSLCFI